MDDFDQESFSPLFRNLIDPMVSHEPNVSMEHEPSQTSHDEDEALRVPLQQVHNIAKMIDKMQD